MISRFVCLCLPSTGSSFIMISRFVPLCLPSTGSSSVVISRFVSLCLPVFPKELQLMGFLSQFKGKACLHANVCLPFIGSSLPSHPFYCIQFHHDFHAILYVCLPLSPFHWIPFTHDFQASLHAPFVSFYWIQFPQGVRRLVSMRVSLCLPFIGSSFIMISRLCLHVCLPLSPFYRFRHDFEACLSLSPFVSTKQLYLMGFLFIQEPSFCHHDSISLSLSLYLLLSPFYPLVQGSSSIMICSICFPSNFLAKRFHFQDGFEAFEACLLSLPLLPVCSASIPRPGEKVPSEAHFPSAPSYNLLCAGIQFHPDLAVCLLL